jgi:hypothetical protein
MHFNWHLCALLFCFAAATLPTSIYGTGAIGELTQRHPKNASSSITEENNQNDEQGKLNNHWKMFFREI